MPKTRVGHVVAAAVALLAGPAALPAQSIALDPGTPYGGAGPVVSAAFGSSMDGMLVTGYLSNGTSVSDTWRDLGGGLHGIITGGLSYTVGATYDTFGAPWTLTNNTGFGLTRLVLVGSPGNTVFDWLFSGSGKTPGSGSGRAFDYSTGSFNPDPYRTVERYRNIVSLGGIPPVGDLYDTLDASFGIAIPDGTTVVYGGDTDVLATAPLATPEPATLALVVTGLGAMTLVRRRRA